MDPAIACPSCGASPMQRYCGQCGEKRISRHDLSLRHYATEFLEIITHLDSRILRATWELVRHPGGLSASHFDGRRVRYVTPLRLFVVLSVVYFLSATIYPNPAFTTPLAIQLHGNNFYPGFAAHQVALALQHKGWDYATLERNYNAKTAVLSKTMLFAIIPIFALAFQVLLIRKRRYFSEHVVVATHFWSFALLLIGVFIPLLLTLLAFVGPRLGVPPGTVTEDVIPTVILQCGFALYLFIMLRRVYAISYWYSALVAGAIAWSFFFLVWIFRFLLFVVTLRLL